MSKCNNSGPRGGQHPNCSHRCDRRNDRGCLQLCSRRLFFQSWHSIEHQFDWKGDGTVLSSWSSAAQSRRGLPGYLSGQGKARCATHTTLVSKLVKFPSVSIRVPGFPVVRSFAIKNGASSSRRRAVILNNMATNKPCITWRANHRALLEGAGGSIPRTRNLHSVRVLGQRPSI